MNDQEDEELDKCRVCGKDIVNNETVVTVLTSRVRSQEDRQRKGYVKGLRPYMTYEGGYIHVSHLLNQNEVLDNG